jgi:D-glycero-D-manno-heptose 1,7-bisphosphate phosphatase
VEEDLVEQAERRVAIFDRDGTIIDVVRDEDSGFVGVAFHPSQLKLLRGAVAGLRAFASAGFQIAIATNQPGPAKGQFSIAAVERTNAALVSMLAVEGVKVDYLAVCMHHESGGPEGDVALVKSCLCRKPAPGLLFEILNALGAEPSGSWMFGDSPGDVAAGFAAGLRTAMVFDPKRCELCPLRGGAATQARPPDLYGPSLEHLAALVLQKR